MNGTTGRALEDIRSVLRMVRPVTDTQSPIMRDRKLVRHFETMDVSLAHLRAAAAAPGQSRCAPRWRGRTCLR